MQDHIRAKTTLGILSGAVWLALGITGDAAAQTAEALLQNP